MASLLQTPPRHGAVNAVQHGSIVTPGVRSRRLTKEAQRPWLKPGVLCPCEMMRTLQVMDFYHEERMLLLRCLALSLEQDVRWLARPENLELRLSLLTKMLIDSASTTFSPFKFAAWHTNTVPPV